MKKWIERAFTRTELRRKGRSKRLEKVQVPPSTRLLYTVYISMVMLAGLIILQIVHLIVLKQWNNEVWTGISSLIGILSGIFLGAKA